MKTLSNKIMEHINIKKPKRVLKESNYDDVQVFMNTWANYNEYGADEGITPTGWMSIDDALEYCEKYAEYEPFINDYENTPIEVSEYDSPVPTLEFIKRVDEHEDSEIIKNALEIADEGDYEATIEAIERGDYVWFPGCEDDFDLGKDYVDMVGFSGVSHLDWYFKEDDYKDDIYNDEKDYYASEHGIDTEDEDFPEDDFEDWLDEVIESEKHNLAEVFEHDDTYFDYDRLGSDLEDDGYRFTTDGCIQVML